MSRVLQIRRGTTAQNNNFTGMPGEISFDTDAKTLRVHDGVCLGGYALARADQINSGGDNNQSAPAFDISSVPDSFWAAKIPQFAAPTIISSNIVTIRNTAYLEYIFNTTKTPVFADVALKAKSADAGYVANDIVNAFGVGDVAHPLPNIFTDNLGIHVRLLTGGGTFWVSHNDTGVTTNIDATNWGLIFRLYC